MEAVNRQSGVHSLINRDHYYSPTIKVPERELPPTQSTTPASVISPTTMYPNHPPPPYSHSSSAPSSAHPFSGLISPSQSHPAESRRTSSDIKDIVQPHRQSLPSIQEALLAPAAFALPRNPVDPPPPSQYGTYAQYPPTPTSRANSMDTGAYQPQPSLTQPQRTSPSHTIHPSPYHRPDPVAPSYDHSRHPTLPSIRTALPSQSNSHPGPATEFPRHEADPRAITSASAGYSHPPSHGVQHSTHPTAAPYAAESAAYSPQSPYLQHRHYRPRFENGEEQSKAAENPVAHKVYGPVVKRHLEYWDIEMELSNIRNCSSELSKISQTLLQESQRNTSHGAMPERVPSQQDVDLMRIQHDKLSVAMQRMSEKIAVQGQYSGDQHGAPPSGKVPDDYSQEEMSWDDGRGMGGYVGSDAKKRRGRAAPPGRCHSCNRAETPEWRRGPDGARTLCNACGLHYAKLTRKLGSKQAQNAGASLRQNAVDEVSPRS